MGLKCLGRYAVCGRDVMEGGAIAAVHGALQNRFVYVIYIIAGAAADDSNAV